MGTRAFAMLKCAYRNYSGKSAAYPRKSTVGVELHEAGNKKNRPKSSRTRASPLEWTEEQTRIISAVSGGRSVFIAGSAGTGKTALLKHIIKLLKDSLGRSTVFVTASTGVAACALRGQTLHSFAGIKNPGREASALDIYMDKKACKRWRKVRALFIDEISMVDGELFDNLECIARELRESGETWGGIQLIATGDFLQLPPIPRKGNCLSSKQFAFEADCWQSSFDLQIELTKVFRQSDERLVKVLQGIRKGEISPDDWEFLEQSCATDEPDPSVVRLYPRNEDVNEVNNYKIEELAAEGYVFSAADSGSDPWKRQLKRGMAPDEIFLCKGARVMLIKNKNTSRGLVNGAVGTVVGFVKPEDMVVSDLCCEGILPMVKFDSGRTVVIEPETWYVVDGDSVVAQRKQIPLILAWALSIHKCQGMSLDSLHTDLTRSFGYGMVYVALSRVRSLSGLHLSGFDPTIIKANPKALEFYQRLAHQCDKRSKDDGSSEEEHNCSDSVDSSS
ncbi:ATP-dependent DNA helicase PIF1-like [Rhodamnia argentea]|uniref:ATP-dependent DNA helicase n=1 Tax=Rhodamnia argentea TaxID=178133 RepID=A0A8B8N802_9MYRT|nr:ATP-dependent DNA helicase PIF1-like [Rhodamnia argentea]